MTKNIVTILPVRRLTLNSGSIIPADRFPRNPLASAGSPPYHGPMFKVLSKLRLSCLKRLASDKTLVEQLYKSVYGHLPDLIHPRTFDEKLQWYKLYYRKPIMTQLADKFRVREYVTQKGLGPILIARRVRAQGHSWQRHESHLQEPTRLQLERWPAQAQALVEARPFPRRPRMGLQGHSAENHLRKIPRERGIPRAH